MRIARRIPGVSSMGLLLALSCEPISPPPSADEEAAPAPEVPDADPILFLQAVPEELPARPGEPHLEMPAFPHPPGNTQGCPDGMLRVTGNYCLEALQTCVQHHPDTIARQGDPTVSERCLRYLMPSRCAGQRYRPMDYCMDRYEYPNEVGELPWVLTSWREARRLCQTQGKRLCTVEEFNFACEGPGLNPYATGYERDEVACNIDQLYYLPDHSRQLLTYKRCLKDEWCTGELQRLDQRHAIGRRLQCASWAGIVDLNGNVNEWVEVPRAKPPRRSGLKGGWWGPVRNRCRPTVTFHDELDYGYEAGFRCCKSIGDDPPETQYTERKFTLSPEQVYEETLAPETAADAGP